MSHNPLSSQGVNFYRGSATESLDWEALGTEVDFSSLPNEVVEAIRLKK
jgi:hypothetical protein